MVRNQCWLVAGKAGVVIDDDGGGTCCGLVGE